MPDPAPAGTARDEAGGAPLPKVSIHVPAHNEPPAMVIETLEALARLDYPDFEVLVVDNNTRDEAVWRAGRGALRRARPALPLLPRAR
jgi:cellulose synthase/poly-beta-1,6-N-acetylglucosamine synthase-like glycosyltransferase